MLIFDVIIYTLLFLIIITDFLYFEIKNQHVILLFCITLSQLIFFNKNIEIFHLVIPLSLFLILSAIAYRNYIGGGDVKLITVLSISLSIDELLGFLISMSFVGGVEVILYLIFKRKIHKLQKIVYKITNKIFLKKILFSINQKLIIYDENNYLNMGIPYGIAISLGFIIGRI